jgi:hypothetical protein
MLGRDVPGSEVDQGGGAGDPIHFANVPVWGGM